MAYADLIANELLKPGSIFETKMAGPCKIVKYEGSTKVHVKFLETGFETTCQTIDLKRGTVKDYLHPSVFGVGYLSAKNSDITYRKLWTDMLRRCYDPKHQSVKISYVGCTVVKRWHNLQNFIEDVSGMDNAFKAGFDLDKDLRVLGNKKYGPKYCSFVPRTLNAALVGNFKTFGVTKKTRNGKITIGYSIETNGRSKFVTTHDEELARKLYLKEKVAQIRLCAEKYKLDIHPDVYTNLSSLTVAKFMRLRHVLQ